MSEHLHDPGGKVRIRIASETVGDAHFSPCGRYRLWLSRRLGDEGLREATALWIGMNPSTAVAELDDPTVSRETGFTRRWGIRNYLKTNVMDYRATDPKMLLAAGVAPCSDDNLPAIREFAADAEFIVLAFGALHKRLAVHGENVVRALRADGRKLHCLKLTKHGAPGHPLYLKSSSEMIPFP